MYFHYCRLESPTRSLDVGASQEIFFKSQSGGIDASCLANLKLQSTAGTVCERDK